METKEIKGQTFDEERALYNLQNAVVSGCTFAGSRDGESALKQANGVEVDDCRFSLRYPLWHTDNFTLKGCSMDEKTRAAIWYSTKGEIKDSRLGGIKALRECAEIYLENCEIKSPEFGWKSRDIEFNSCKIDAEYFMFDSRNVKARDIDMQGKYSFQYIENMTIENSRLNTKDAFWHTKGVTVKNSIIKGEYLGWYSEDLTLINCEIIGTQPLCYCKNLRLINCKTSLCDLAFEYSDVTAELIGHIDSVKNPLSGRITAGSIGQIIKENSVFPTNCEILIK